MYDAVKKECSISMNNDPLTPGESHHTCGIASLPPVQTPAPPSPTTPIPTFLPATGVQNTWAVIAVGSSGFSNYRHQADGCHAYHVLRKSGVHAEQIIVMMQDDIATSPENPFPGKLFNRNGTDSPDVYSGCHIDYRGSIVTANLFVNVITGNESAVPKGGKVLKSKAPDRVFLNFVDHGGVGIVEFPNGEPLHVSDLSSALKTMKQKNMFGKLLFYMEACNSGSMFPDLTSDGKIYAVAAANSGEPSFGYYCGPYATVNGTNLHTCLGDLFSTTWMEDAEEGRFATETIKTQVHMVVDTVDKSHVTTFGDTSFESEPFGGFALHAPKAGSTQKEHIRHRHHSHDHAVDVRDIPMEEAYYKAFHARTVAAKEAAWKEYQEIMEGRKADDAIFQNIVREACAFMWIGWKTQSMEDCIAKMDAPNPDLKSESARQCHKTLTSTVFGSCPRRFGHNPGGWNAYNMKHSKQLANICVSLDSLKYAVEDLENIVRDQCSSDLVLTLWGPRAPVIIV